MKNLFHSTAILIWYTSDSSMVVDMQINLDEFADLCNAIALRFQKEDVVSSISLSYGYNMTCAGIKGFVVTFIVLSACRNLSLRDFRQSTILHFPKS